MPNIRLLGHTDDGIASLIYFRTKLFFSDFKTSAIDRVSESLQFKLDLCLCSPLPTYLVYTIMPLGAFVIC